MGLTSAANTHGVDLIMRGPVPRNAVLHIRDSSRDLDGITCRPVTRTLIAYDR
jgi:hypothetical protein